MKTLAPAGLAALSLSLVAASAANAELIYGITGSSAGASLVSFDSATPGSITSIGSLSGVLPGHAVRAIDFRPATGELFAVSNNGTAGQVYRVNLGSGQLTPVGSGFAFPVAPSARISIDFNPTVDRIRLITADGQNLRLNPITGGVAAVDTNLAWAPGDPNGPGIPFGVGAAYTNNFAGATSTTMYTYDFITDSLATQGGLNSSPSPNGGQWFSVGSSGVVTGEGGVGFDISSTTGTAYVSYNDFNQASNFERLGTVNLSTGAFSLVGAFGSGVDMLDISVVIPAPSSAGALALAGLVAMRRRRA